MSMTIQPRSERRTRAIEAWGRGIERIFAACRNADTPKPRIRFETGGLWSEFPFGKAYLKQVEGGREAAAGPVTPEVTPEVARLLAALTREMSRTEIMAALGLKDEKHFRERYQQAAVKLGLVEMTIPDKPRSQSQKYRLTALGRARLAAEDSERS